MKKKLVSILLALSLALSLAPAALALGAFSDVTNAEDAQNIEVLRLLGVLEGDGAGQFRPNDSLTRAEFCKMAVVMTGKRSVVSRYSSRTIFPDVRATSWAAGYVNYAASKDVGLIHGMPDGTFAPSRAITYGEAVTILTRLLGYTDADTNGVWPDGYIALAGAAGMTRGLSVAGGATITRAQAAKLFVNALSAKNDKDEVLANRYYTVDLKKDPVTLYSVDPAKGVLRTSDKTNPDVKLANPMTSTALNNVKGWVVTNAAGEAVTFLPSSSASTGSALSDAAIIVSANGSTAGLDVLTGGADNYVVYRNGVPTTAAELKQGDVVIYSAANNAVLACDTRVAVHYENCSPSPAAPNTITVLGGTELTVLPTARQSLSKFKPGQNMTILLTADGRVAGATESGGNAFAYVNDSGEVSLIYGNSMLPVGKNLGSTTMSTDKVLGSVARITQSGSNGKSTIYLSKQVSANGNLDPVKGTLGTRKVADGALVFSGDKLTSITALGKTVVPQGRIAYARVNNAGEIDLIVVKDSDNAIYGRAIVTQREIWRDGIGDEPGYVTVNDLAIDCGGTMSEKLETAYAVSSGAYVSATVNKEGNRYTNVANLTKLPAVSASAWIGDSVVNYGDQTYVLSDHVICYNRDSGSWFDSFETAKAYGGTMDLYVKDGVIHAVEVRS